MHDPVVCLDADGILCDFVSAANRAINIPAETIPECWDWWTAHGFTDDQFWGAVNRRGLSFYTHDVKPFPWAQDVIRLAKQFGHVVIATATSPRHETGDYGKRLWCREHCAGIEVISIKSKFMLAGSDRFLIDDCDENVRKFCEKKGWGHVFAHPFNSNRSRCGDRIESMVEDLEIWRHNIG